MPSSEPIVVLGATGQLGSDLVAAAQERGEEVVGLSHADLEVTDAEQTHRIIRELNPRTVINAAAFHQVERCDEQPEEAFRVNAVGSLNSANAATAAGAAYVYVSTDYIFAGDKPAPADGATTPDTSYLEGDAPGPLNVYGASKLGGEQLARMAAPDPLIVRVSSLFGIAGARGKGGNFIEAILKKARNGGPLTVVDDQWMTPTYTVDAANAVMRLVAEGASGTVHVTNPEACTWHRLATRALQAVGLNVDVEPVPSFTYATTVKRPQNSALNTGRLSEVLGVPLRPWPEALHHYLAAKGYVS